MRLLVLLYAWPEANVKFQLYPLALRIASRKEGKKIKVNELLLNASVTMSLLKVLLKKSRKTMQSFHWAAEQEYRQLRNAIPINRSMRASILRSSVYSNREAYGRKNCVQCGTCVLSDFGGYVRWHDVQNTCSMDLAAAREKTMRN